MPQPWDHHAKLIAGTKTNVCCESTARDGMMLDFNVDGLDACAALSEAEHRAALETIIQQFGDVRTVDEVLDILDHPIRADPANGIQQKQLGERQ